jgi:hypothetical protein
MTGGVVEGMLLQGVCVDFLVKKGSLSLEHIVYGYLVEFIEYEEW